MTFQRILVPTDFSEGAEAALKLAVEVARLSGGRITLLHVGATSETYAAWGMSAPMLSTMGELAVQLVREQAALLRDQIETLIPEENRGAVLHQSGLPEEVINRLVKDGGYDLVVMGTHGRTGLDRVLLGSVAERVIRKASVPVMVTR